MTTPCFHCGEAVPTGFSATLKIKGKNEPFCCYGCLAVAEVISHEGLDNFYAHRTEFSPKAEELKPSELKQLELYDDPLLQEEFVQAHDGVLQTSLSISGITCAACIWLLERDINAIDGVLNFSINHSTHKAYIEWETPCQLSEVLIKARKLGYNAKPYRHHEAKLAALREKRITVFRIAVAGIATMQNMMFSIPLYLGMYNDLDTQLISLFRWVSMFMAAPVVAFASLPFYRAAIRSLKSRKLGMDMPVSFAIIIAFLASSYTTITTVPTLESDVYFDSVSMFAFFLLLGRFIEMQTRHRYLNDDVDMDQLLPETATLVEGDSTKSLVSQRIQVGDIIRIKQGELAAADGLIENGSTRFDESALTGEFLPIYKATGDVIHAGTANMDNTIDIRVTASAKQSRLSSIVRLIGKAQAAKPSTQTIADNLASYFVTFVLLACGLTAVYWWNIDSDRAFAITLSVLVVTCPCALSLATPTALTGATSALRRLGFLLTKHHALEAMSQANDVIFDKTGTLSEGRLSISHVQLATNTNLDKETALIFASALERQSAHPIAKAFIQQTSKEVIDAKNHVGLGVSGIIDGSRYFMGSASFIEQNTSTLDKQELQHQHDGPVVFMSDGTTLVARFELEDTLREEAAACIETLRKLGKTVHILSGDQHHSVKHVADTLSIESFLAEQSPEQKLNYVESLQSEGRKVAMVGDGINDLPVLSRANLSIAMGGASDLTKLNADAILLNEHLVSLADAFQYSRRTRTVIIQNICWALGYNLCMLPLAVVGLIPPYFAALGMSLSSLIVVFNSMRLRK